MRKPETKRDFMLTLLDLNGTGYWITRQEYSSLKHAIQQQDVTYLERANQWHLADSYRAMEEQADKVFKESNIEARSNTGKVKRKYSHLFDLFMIIMTSGLWIIWMLIRPKYY